MKLEKCGCFTVSLHIDRPLTKSAYNLMLYIDPSFTSTGIYYAGKFFAVKPSKSLNTGWLGIKDRAVSVAQSLYAICPSPKGIVMEELIITPHRTKVSMALALLQGAIFATYPSVDFTLMRPDVWRKHLPIPYHRQKDYYHKYVMETYPCVYAHICEQFPKTRRGDVLDAFLLHLAYTEASSKHLV